MEQCNVPATARINCGPPGITEAQCKAKHCCFDSNVRHVPWCFKPASVEGFSQLYGVQTLKILNNGLGRLGKSGQPPEFPVFKAIVENFGSLNSTELEKGQVYASGRLTSKRTSHDPTSLIIWTYRFGLRPKTVLSEQHEGSKHGDDTKCRCDFDPHKRSNCGPPGITPQQCKNSGCCFNSTERGLPWCFKPTPPKFPEQCQVQPRARVNCGYPYISAQECYKRGCCFDSSIAGVIWCFFPQHNTGIDSGIDATG
ncbi:putative gastrointestinal growth factor xP4 [Erythrolamprus reginae]|uniref:putative gastrointestinal growth factor xP4 n=1 Tax=Erythrolamprus reginae TaxID=121349 RepID=UPI00396CDB5A